ncbi:hypothetical protein ACFJGW_10360 [Burkholderiaceae bacterium UC74_6]
MLATCPNQLDLHYKGRNIAVIVARKAQAGAGARCSTICVASNARTAGSRMLELALADARLSVEDFIDSGDH